MVVFMQSIQHQFNRQDVAMGQAEDDEIAIATAIQQAGEAFQPQARRWMRIVWSGTIGDVVFYGAFLVGVFQIVQGFWAQP
jgi:hypothetical protein